MVKALVISSGHLVISSVELYDVIKLRRVEGYEAFGISEAGAINVSTRFLHSARNFHYPQQEFLSMTDHEESCQLLWGKSFTRPGTELVS
jgi:hypothetical protein